MRVSVVIPSFDAGRFLVEAVASVRVQSYRDVEIIVVDDGSTDGSVDAVEAQRGVVVVRLDRGGGPRARNVGLTRATGDAVVFLDADDLLGPDTIAAQVAALERAPRRAVAVAPWRLLVQRDGVWGSVPHRIPHGPDPFADWLVRRYQLSAALLWPVALVRELGGWDEALTKNQDGDLALRALVSGVGLVPAAARTFAHYRQAGPHGGTVASRTRAIDVASCVLVIDRIADTLARQGRFERYRVAIARAYHELARLYWFAEPALASRCETLALALAGRSSVSGTWAHRTLTRVVGLAHKERIASSLAAFGLGRELRLARAVPR